MQDRYYRPIIFASCVFGLSLGLAPLFMNSMVVLLKPILEEFAWSRTQVSTGLSFTWLALAVASPIAGRLMDRIGPKRLIVISTAAFSVALALFSFLPPNYPVFIAFAMLTGIVGTGTVGLTYLRIVTIWFERRLGLMLGLVTVGGGIASGLGPIAVEAIAARVGWRGTFLVLACAALLTTLNALFILRERPVDAPEMDKPARPHQDTQRDALWKLLRDPMFVAFAGSIFTMSLVSGGLLGHMVALLTDRGYSSSDAVRMLVSASAGLIAARFVIGAALDRFTVGPVAAVGFLLSGVGVLLLWSGAGGATPVIAIFLIGSIMGSEGDIMPYAVRRCFDQNRYGLTYGALLTASFSGLFLGPIALGQSFDRLGSYEAIMPYLCALIVFAALAMLTVRPRQQSIVPLGEHLEKV